MAPTKKSDKTKDVTCERLRKGSGNPEIYGRRTHLQATNDYGEDIGAATCFPRSRTVPAENVEAETTCTDKKAKRLVYWNALFHHYDACQQEQVACRTCQTKLKSLVQWNVFFQHYYVCRKEQRLCEKCQDVKEFISHKTECDAHKCARCKFFDELIRYHKRSCRIGMHSNEVPCTLCEGGGGFRKTELVGGDRGAFSAVPPSLNDEKIFAEITPIKGTPLVGEGFKAGEDYELDDKLGEGGFGEVFDVKLLCPGERKLGGNCRLVAKMTNVTRNEITVLKRLTHKNVPDVATHYFIVDKRHETERIDNRTGQTKVKKYKHLMFMKRAEMSLHDYKSKRKDSVLTLNEACYFFRQVLGTVLVSHRFGIIHHDIKSKNVLLMSDGVKYSAYLTDYEFAVLFGPGCPNTGDARRGGTKYFKPPVMKDDPSDDVYSLGKFFLEITIPGATRSGSRGHQVSHATEAAKLQQLKSMHQGIGELIETCVEEDARKRPAIWQVISKLNEYMRTIEDVDRDC